MKFFSTFFKTAIVFSLILVSCKPAEVTQQESEPVEVNNIQQQVSRLIINMPAENQQREVWANEQLLDIGDEAVGVLSEMLMDPALGSDLQARYALSGLANYVARPGAESKALGDHSAV